MINIEKLERKAYFNIGNCEYYEGYHIPENRWNGWATPKFEKYIADLITHNFSTKDFKINYDKENDCYIIINESNEVEKVEKSTINTNDGKKEVYDFGSVGWTWDSYTLDEAKKRNDAHIISNDIETTINTEDSINMDY